LHWIVGKQPDGGHVIEKQWVVQKVDQEQRVALAEAMSISLITASVLLGRGVTNQKQAQDWMKPHQVAPHDPFLLPDMRLAIDRLHQAVTEGEHICFYGDYDVDGITATSLYLTYFRSLGAKATAYIPHRMREGYGLNDTALRWLQREGVSLVVTSDCGTTAHKEAEEARRLGLDLIITDHHQVDVRLPAAVALINPYRPDSRYPFKGLCSGGLAYKVVRAYEDTYGGGTDPESFLDLVALATVADVVPLHDENRLFVREGLALIGRGARCGVRALKQVAGVTGTCTTGAVAFRLAPRINAAGRLDHAEAAVRLLTTESEAEAKGLAEKLEQLNRTRQGIEQGTTTEAQAMVATDAVPKALVVWASHWHQGVVGIVAARLVERFHRPVVVLAVNERGVGKGSARSVPGFDLYHALSDCRDLLDAFGGHPCAAGLTIQASRLEEFRTRFADVAARWSGERPMAPSLHVDAEVGLDQVDRKLVQEFDLLHPFGAGNPEPTLAVRNLLILDSRVVGEKHLKLTVRHKNSVPFEGIGFRMGSPANLGLAAGRSVDLAFVPERNSWNGLERIQLRIRDVKVRPS
jgi:single-stranded-DNA-specific exonuclease